MKFKLRGVILSLFLALGLVFSLSIEMSAHEGDHSNGADITAEDVDPMDTQQMSDFVQHIVDYYNHVEAKYMDDRPELRRQTTILLRELRKDDGEYKHGDIYHVGIIDGRTVTNHAKYPKELMGLKFNPDAEDSVIASTLKKLLDKAEESGVGGDPVCEEDYDGLGRVACAARTKGVLAETTQIAGLVHEKDDLAFKAPDCGGLDLETTAEDVFADPTDANLEAYVKDVIKAGQEEVAEITKKALVEMFGPELGIQQLGQLATDSDKRNQLQQGVTKRLLERIACFARGDFKHENIYIFIMSANPESPTVLLNGNNYDLNGGNLELSDEELEGEDKTIAGLFKRALGDAAVGNSAYVDYRWDDPTTDADDIDGWFEMNSVPGNSPKRSYIEVADRDGMLPGVVSDLLGFEVTSELISGYLPPQPLIFGSGIYNPEPKMMTKPPEKMMEMKEAGGGCAVFGAEYASRSDLLNLFLAASVLFSLVLLRRRA